MKVILLLLSMSLFASLPPVESLFRHAGNKEIEADTVILDLKLKFLVPMDAEESNGTLTNSQDRYLRVILNQSAYGSFELLQIEFEDPSMKNDSILSLYEGRSIFKYMLNKKDLKAERDFFYSLLVSILLNDSSLINGFLKKTNNDYLSNSELVNSERRKLYDNYKKYLQTIKDEPSLSEELISPMKPESQEDKENVRSLVKETYYKKSDALQLIKEGNKFFLSLKLEKTKAKFDNKTHDLLEFSFNDLRGDVDIKMLDYLLLNGINEFPKTIFLKSNGQSYSLEAKKLRYLSYKPATYKKIKRSLKNALSRKVVEEGYMRPSFLF